MSIQTIIEIGSERIAHTRQTKTQLVIVDIGIHPLMNQDQRR